MHFELYVLVTVAAGALAALVDSARHATRPEPEARPLEGPIPTLRADLEELERTRAGVDDAAPRLLVVLAAIAASAAIGCELVARCTELSAVLVALGAGLALPGIAWARDQRRRAIALDARILDLRARLDARSPAPRDRELTRAGALPRRP